MKERYGTVLRFAAYAALLMVVVTVSLVAVPQVTGAEHSYVVLSSSMSPSIPAGAVVFVDEVPSERIDENDVITFTSPSRAASAKTARITHRVVDVVRRSDDLYFRTKGDANEAPDPWLVSNEAVLGRVQFSLPYIGYLIAFVHSRAGIVLFVIIPTVLLALTELLALTDTRVPGFSELAGSARSRELPRENGPRPGEGK